MQKVVILTTERSGSTLLCDLLDQCKNSRFYGELFNSTEIQMRRETIRTSVALQDRDASPVEFLQKTMLSAQNEGLEVVGFKFFFYHHETVLQHLIEDITWKIVVLQRENLLARYSSLRIAERTGEWGVLRHTQPTPLLLRFDEGDFEDFEGKAHAMRELVMRGLSLGGREIFLMDFVSILDRRTLDRLAAYLEMDIPETIVPRIRKQNPTQTINRFSNPDHVRSYLAARNRQRWAFEG